MNLEFNMADATRVWKNDGRMEKAEEVAEKMLRRGTPIEIVAEDTELTVAQIEKIVKKMNSDK